MRRSAAILLLSVCGACSQPPSTADRTAAVAVTTIAPRQGTVVRRVVAYGTATPAANGTATLSVAQPGQVVELLVTQGATVRAGQTLLVFEVAPSARAGYEAATTSLEAAIRQRDTTRRLLDQQLATQDQLVQSEKAVVDASAALAAQRQEGAGEVRQKIVAPFEGIVTALPLVTGDRTQPGAALATVARRQDVVVTVGVDAAARAGIAVGGAAKLERLGGGASIAARILRIDGELNPATHLVDVDLAFQARALLPGEPLKAEIASGTVAGWLVPHASVATDANGPHVFQVFSGKARAVPVTIVQSGTPDDVVAGRITPDHPIVLDGAYQVADGDGVRPAKP